MPINTNLSVNASRNELEAVDWSELVSYTFSFCEHMDPKHAMNKLFARTLSNVLAGHVNEAARAGDFRRVTSCNAAIVELVKWATER